MDPIVYINNYKKHTLSLSFNELLPFIKEFNEDIPIRVLFEEYNAFKETLDNVFYLPHKMINHDYTYENINKYLKLSIEKRYFTIEELATCKVSSRMKHFIIGSTLIFVNYIPEQYASYVLDSYMYENIAYILIYLFECTKPNLASLECIALYHTLFIYDRYEKKLQKYIDKSVNINLGEPYFKTNEVYAHQHSIYLKNYSPPINTVFFLYEEETSYDSFLYNYLGYMVLMYYSVDIRIKSNEIKFRQIRNHKLPDSLKIWVYDIFLKQISKFIRYEGYRTLEQLSTRNPARTIYIKGKSHHTYRILIQNLRDIEITNMKAPQFYATINTLKNKMELNRAGFIH